MAQIGRMLRRCRCRPTSLLMTMMMTVQYPLVLVEVVGRMSHKQPPAHRKIWNNRSSRNPGREAAATLARATYAYTCKQSLRLEVIMRSVRNWDPV
jgi:hypothetical protein